MNIKDFDKFLSENSAKPDLVIMHPSVWNGYWSIHKVPRAVSVTFRILGRKLKSRRLYWIGLPLFWISGLKECPEFEGVEAIEVYDERF